MAEENNVEENKGLSAEFVDNKELRKQIGALNKTGILKEKIKSIGKSRAELYDIFLDAVAAIPEGSEDEKKLPDSVIGFYNSIVEGTDPTPEEQEAMKAAKVKKEPKPRGKNYEELGYDLVKSMAGKSIEEIEAAGVALYTPLYAAKTPPKTDPVWILERTKIYVNIAVKDIKKENAHVEVATA